MAVSWYSRFENYCRQKGVTDFGLWKEIREVLQNSLNNKENIFPPKTVRHVLITLNGKALTSVKVNKDESVEKYLFALSSSDLTANEGVVRLSTAYTARSFSTRDGNDEEKEFAFMLELINKIRVDSFITEIGLNSNEIILNGTLSANNIRNVYVNSNPLLCTLDVITGDYMLACTNMSEFIKTVRSDKINNVNTYCKLMLELNKVNSISDSLEYFFVKSSSKKNKVYDTRYTVFTTLKTGLTDIVPVCVKFPEIVKKNLDSGITLVNNLDNTVFDGIMSDNSPIFCDTTGEFDIESSKIEFKHDLDLFRKSVRNKVFDAPGIGSSDEVIKVACASRKDIFELTKIKFNNYSFTLMNFILSCMFKKEIGSLIPYSINRLSSSVFNLRLKELAGSAGRTVT